MEKRFIIIWLLGIAAVFVVTAGNVVAFPVEGQSESFVQQFQNMIAAWDSVNISDSAIMLICGTALVGLAGFIRRKGK